MTACFPCSLFLGECPPVKDVQKSVLRRRTCTRGANQETTRGGWVLQSRVNDRSAPLSAHSAPDNGSNKREISSRETLLCSAQPSFRLRRRYVSSLCSKTIRARLESRGSNSLRFFTRFAATKIGGLRERLNALSFLSRGSAITGHDPRRSTVRERMSTRESGDRGGRDISDEPGAPGISFAAWWQPCCRGLQL